MINNTTTTKLNFTSHVAVITALRFAMRDLYPLRKFSSSRKQLKETICALRQLRDASSISCEKYSFQKQA